MLIFAAIIAVIIAYNFLVFLRIENGHENEIENIFLLPLVFIPIVGTYVLMTTEPNWKKKPFNKNHRKEERELTDYERDYRAEAERKKRGEYTEKEKSDMLEMLKNEKIFEEECKVICREFNISTKPSKKQPKLRK